MINKANFNEMGEAAASLSTCVPDFMAPANPVIGVGRFMQYFWVIVHGGVIPLVCHAHFRAEIYIYSSPFPRFFS